MVTMKTALEYGDRLISLTLEYSNLASPTGLDETTYLAGKFGCRQITVGRIPGPMVSGQSARSEAERKLPEGVREQLDWARSGHDPKWPHRKWPLEKCRAFVRLWLPENDPGSI